MEQDSSLVDQEGQPTYFLTIEYRMVATDVEVKGGKDKVKK